VRAPIVIKIGGGEGIDLPPIVEQAGALVRTGERVVLVHGGSRETTRLGERLGCPPRFIESPSGHTSRRTDAETLDVFTMACAGRINKRLVAALRAEGVDAIGLCGIDGGLWRAERKSAVRAVQDGRIVLIRDDLTGRVVEVDAGLLNMLVEGGRTPVLSPPGVTAEGAAVNVDADRSAAATAAAIGASELLLLSNVPGVLRDPADAASLISGEDGLEKVRAAARGRMKNKTLAAEEALVGGVERVVIGSAIGSDAIERARAGEGTVLLSESLRAASRS